MNDRLFTHPFSAARSSPGKYLKNRNILSYINFF